MSKLNFVRRCYNCGAILQADDPSKDGYVDPELLESSDTAVLFCEKCWKEQRYNISPREPRIDPQYLDMLKDAQASDALIVYVVDLFSFEASFISDITSIIEGLNIVVIANKRDLMPAKCSDADLKEYVAHRFRVSHLSVTADDVFLTSLTSATDIKELVGKIDERRRRHDVYIIGAIGAGKTLFVNSFLRNYNNASHLNITTSNYPGTNIRLMQIPLDSSSALYDTPGTSTENSLISKLDVASAYAVVPEDEIKGRKINITKGESIFIGGVARVDLIEGARQNVIGYFAKDVTLKKCARNLDEAFIKSIEKKTVRPICSTATALHSFDAFDITVEETGPRDIGIEGLGWINFTGNKQTWRIYVPKGISVYTTRAKVK